jgi:SulP family sulfate permease
MLNAPEELIIDFAENRVVDLSGMKALNKITERCHKVVKKLHLKHPSPDCRQLLKNTERIMGGNIIYHPTYCLGLDRLA